ncbi:adenosylcobinamide-phosphate synthase CbiB [Eubacterium oxidoreducens]|uniref:Cobalamin biosynthesis protein CobD n=1 Tax=Eubacterium oxidoreducens TaxID=1732 RepID=A0A1G6BI91_EUBOX|nr:adenosylcobinamide-phosphate synthase CbiB [Eubacterium oxidoreducens]SDB20298.1 adenosylcobinamide-phosphate synthase [Eubacterium oxidoreducens]
MILRIIINYWTFISFSIIIGYFADLLFGDPQGRWHPIRLIGGMIAGTKKILRRILPKKKAGEIVGGILLVLIVLLFTGVVTTAVLFIGLYIHWLLGVCIECYMCYTIFAAKSLRVESMKVFEALQTKGLAEGREAVSMIVGRDTKTLNEEGVIKAAVETIAENTSDGVIAPMIYLIIGGPILGFLYKAVNTMDSMVGYKNDEYLYFGRAAAKTDDVWNFFPARLSALFMIWGSKLAGLNRKEAYRIYIRDRGRHASPNSAQTESVMAGALGVELSGDAWYFGKKIHKPTIGDATRRIERLDILRANKLMYASSALAMIMLFVARWLITLFL